MEDSKGAALGVQQADGPTGHQATSSLSEEVSEGTARVEGRVEDRVEEAWWEHVGTGGAVR